ncbi:MAG: amidohydrolase family protein [Planctomycetes bacterium]|nr:amidohydrolase family protein [Planctomycetota bacterium]
MNRRQFIYTSAIFVSGCANIIRTEPNHPENNLSIVDTHQHLWNLRQFRLPWLRPGGELTRDYSLTDYEQATEGLGITKAIYMEVAVAPEQKLAEAEHIVKICQNKSNSTCAAVIGGLILENDFKNYILKFKDNPYIKGIRHGLNNSRKLKENQLIRNLRLLGTLNMSFDLLVPPGLIGETARLVEQCGNTRFILDHCGNADPLAFDRNLDWDRKPQHDSDQWKADVETLAKQANVICKISGIIARVPKGKATAEVLSPIVTHCLDTFGPDRVVFGGDWPVCTRGAPLRVWTNTLHEIVRRRSFEEKQKLFWKNAHHFYGLT